MATPQSIAADYEAVKTTISQMNSEINTVKTAVKNMVAAVNSANQWRGPDAEAHKEALKKFGVSINNSCNWLRTLDATFNAHAYKLYVRAMNNARAEQFK